MKLATYKNETRDGCLMVVSKDLSRACSAQDIAKTMQDALANWKEIAPQLQMKYQALKDNACDSGPFDASRCESPLPRAYQGADGSAYVNQVELVRKARNAEMPESFWTDPLMYPGGSDDFIGPEDDIILTSDDWGIDFAGEVAVVTDDVPLACTPEQAVGRIRLIMLFNDVTLRGFITGDLVTAFCFFKANPSSTFHTAAVTPVDLGEP